MIATFDFKQISSKVEKSLRDAFPNAAIVTDEGWQGRVHVKIVSPVFNGHSEREKQTIVWDVLNADLHEEAQAVSLAVAYGTDEL